MTHIWNVKQIHRQKQEVWWLEVWVVVKRKYGQILGWLKIPFSFFHKIKQLSFSPINTDLDILSISAIPRVVEH